MQFGWDKTFRNILAAHMSNRFDMLLPVLCALMITTSLLWAGEPTADNTSSREIIINSTHLESLQEVVTVEGHECRIVHIYCEAPDYHWVGDDDEGISCVDDVARAARFYLNEYECFHHPEDARIAAEMLEFVLVMQAEDGEFYNFIWPDYTINKTHRTTVKSLDWWAARGFRSLALGRRVLDGYDDDLTDRLDAACIKTISRLQEQFRTNPERIKEEIAPDIASAWTLGLLEWRQVHPDEYLDQLIEQLQGLVIPRTAFIGHSNNYVIHPAWQNVWHAWGSLMVDARIRAGAALHRGRWTEDALEEAYGFQRFLIHSGFIHEFHIEKLDLDDLKEMNSGNPDLALTEENSFKIDDVKEFPQIAYGMGSLVACQKAAYEFLKHEGGESGWGNATDWAVMAGLAASWLRGNNVAGQQMYDPETGRFYDGLISETEVNYNSGAESTIEGLLALQAIRGLPGAVEAYYSTRQNPSLTRIGVMFRNEQTGTVYQLRFDNKAGDVAKIVLDIERP